MQHRAVPVFALSSLLCLVSSAFLGCASAQRPPSTLGGDGTEGAWSCRNDLEIQCRDGACEASTVGDFTPMDVSLDNAGSLSVCAYSGCWEGQAKVLERHGFLLVVGHDLPFSSAAAGVEDGQDVVLVIDRGDSVATLKVGEFAQPLLCSRSLP